jgi:uncharacterized protein (DUF2147 family)
MFHKSDDCTKAVRSQVRGLFMRRIAFATLCLTFAAPAIAAAPVTGRWYTDGKDSIVEVGPCGGHICGRVAEILKPRPGGPAVDSNNPDPKLRSRPILGMIILSGFKDGGKEWLGSIYDPRAGKTYKSTLARLTNGTLRVKGCWGPFCRSVYFTPVK